ncbi:MAG TPA: aminodeoxychorismate synthase component I [Bacillota bacterium]|nr:aminodeoxychorismate synthase component I [Bacillota bacterium]
MHEIKLLFEYVNHQGRKKPLIFKKPHDIIAANTIEEVLPCLEKVQVAIDKGFYAAGYISYEAAPAFDNAFNVHNHGNMPLMWFGIFEEPIVEKEQPTGDFHASEWKPSVSKDEFKKNIKKIKEYIANGDTKQVNYTIRFNAQFQGDAEAYYKQLAEAQTANYAAYLNTGDFSILSASPELFFHLNDGEITTRPMKGTVKRGKSASEDLQLADWLYHSEKNRNENRIIVDLLRNELGKIAETGTIEVPRLFTIEQYPTVYQMTSTVTAKVNKNLVDVFKALFPCGSITGSPKMNTMNIINELETSPRNVYCGTIGYITPNKEAIFNVPIRTVLINNQTGTAVYGVGGGITSDSTADEEYDEVLTKTRLLKTKQTSFELLETFGLLDGNYIVYQNHMDRLRESAAFFDFNFDYQAVQNELLMISKQHPKGNYRVRLLVKKDGAFTTEVTTFRKKRETTARVSLAKQPIHKDNPFLYHKTTNRCIYEAFQKHHSNVYDVLLWNGAHEVTEFTRGNVVVELNGELVTPPVTCGLLPGTFRRKLIEDGTIKERNVSIHDLKDCTRIWFINSVRQWVEVFLKE